MIMQGKLKNGIVAVVASLAVLMMLAQMPAARAATVSGVTLTSSRNPALPNETVTFTATVSGDGSVPTGAVTFFDGYSLYATRAVGSSRTGTDSTSLRYALSRTVTAHY